MERSGNSVQFFVSSLIFAVGIYRDVSMSHSGAGESGEELEHLIRGLACDHTIETDNLRLSGSVLEVPSVGTVQFSGEFLLREEPTTPQTKSPRNERDDITSNGDSWAAVMHLFDWTDADSDIHIRNEETPGDLLQIKTGVQIIKATDDDLSFLQGFDG